MPRLTIQDYSNILDRTLSTKNAHAFALDMRLRGISRLQVYRLLFLGNLVGRFPSFFTRLPPPVFCWLFGFEQIGEGQ